MKKTILIGLVFISTIAVAQKKDTTARSSAYAVEIDTPMYKAVAGVRFWNNMFSLIKKASDQLAADTAFIGNGDKTVNETRDAYQKTKDSYYSLLFLMQQLGGVLSKDGEKTKK